MVRIAQAARMARKSAEAIMIAPMKGTVGGAGASGVAGMPWWKKMASTA